MSNFLLYLCVSLVAHLLDCMDLSFWKGIRAGRFRAEDGIGVEFSPFQNANVVECGVNLLRGVSMVLDLGAPPF